MSNQLKKENKKLRAALRRIAEIKDLGGKGHIVYATKIARQALEESKCELVLDHDPNWAGDGYFCSKCGQKFIQDTPQLARIDRKKLEDAASADDFMLTARGLLDCLE